MKTIAVRPSALSGAAGTITKKSLCFTAIKHRLSKRVNRRQAAMCFGT